MDYRTLGIQNWRAERAAPEPASPGERVALVILVVVGLVLVARW